VNQSAGPFWVSMLLRVICMSDSFHCVAAAPVDRARAPEVARELTAVHEAGECELVEQARAHVVVALLDVERRDETRGRGDPAEPQRGAERLARRSEVGHVLRRLALQRADRRPVVAQVGVVVVLDDERVGRARPGQQGAPAVAVECRAARERVRRRQQHGAHVLLRELPDVETARVDGDRHGLEPGERQRVAVRREARVLDRDAARAGAVQRTSEQRDALAGAATYEQAVGIREHAADAAEVRGQDAAQLGSAAVVRVAQLAVGDRRERGPVMAQPARAGEQPRVGQPAEQPDRRGRLEQRREPASLDRVRRLRSAADAGARALARLEIAVGRQVGVGLHDDAARNAQVGGEHARGRQARALREPSAQDRRAQLLREQKRLAGARAGQPRQPEVTRVSGIGLLRKLRIGR
jgi:hypothetical protein